MQLLFILPSVTLFALACARAAPRNQDSPRGVVYTARFDNVVYGAVQFFTFNGYVKATVNIENLPSGSGPFTYQIHQRAVPPDGDCYGTFGTFDPYNGIPNAPTWALADVGDLSGKHGAMKAPAFSDTYFDPYLSLNSDNKAFFGHLSVVIRSANGDRIACATINEVEVDAKKLDELQKQGTQTPPEVDAEKSVDVDVDVNKQVDVDKKHGVDVDKKVDVTSTVDAKVDKSKRSNVDVDSGVDVDVDKKVDSGVDVDKKVDVDLPFAAGRVRF